MLPQCITICNQLSASRWVQAIIIDRLIRFNPTFSKSVFPKADVTSPARPMKGYEIIWKVDNYLRNLQPSLDCRGAIFISTSFSGFYMEDSNHSTAPNGLVYMQAMLPRAQSNDDDDTMISISHLIHVQFGWSTASECSVSTQQNCVCVCACCFNAQLCAFEWWQCVDFQQLRIAWTSPCEFHGPPGLCNCMNNNWVWTTCERLNDPSQKSEKWRCHEPSRMI